MAMTLAESGYIQDRSSVDKFSLLRSCQTTFSQRSTAWICGACQELHLTAAEATEDDEILNHRREGAQHEEGLCVFTPELVVIEWSNKEEYAKLQDVIIFVSQKTRRLLFVDKENRVLFQSISQTRLSRARLLILHHQSGLSLGGAGTEFKLCKRKNIDLLTAIFKSHPYQRKYFKIKATFRTVDDADKFMDICTTLVADTPSRIIPEVFFVSETNELAPVKDYYILKWIGDIFTDLVFGEGHKVFETIMLLDRTKWATNPVDTSLKVVRALEANKVPSVIFSDDAANLSRVEGLLDSGRFSLEGSSMTPATHDIVEPQVVPLQYRETMSNTSIHVPVKLLDLIGVTNKARSKSSHLALVAALKCAIVRQVSKWIIHGMHGTIKSFATGARWLTREMLDHSGQPDAGLITEVLWLGHAMNLVSDTDGHVCLWARHDLAAPVYVEKVPEADEDTPGSQPGERLVSGHVMSDDILQKFQGYALPLPCANNPLLKYNPSHDRKLEVSAKVVPRQVKPLPMPQKPIPVRMQASQPKLFEFPGQPLKVIPYRRPRDAFRISIGQE
ncbi:hypothetical protein VNI00_009111 [Paramarasmius palmivorus]|uniref:Uncharacterized protein n=1 Tax=Paramarasmius palmivorus TaxID=297713 RepID=A0AAW0CP64_9AGAR